MSHPPFIVYGLPRSRTFWLSLYLSAAGWSVGHDQARYVRTLDDVKSWLSMPWTGTVETAAAPWWRLVQHLRPDVRVVTIRRDPAEVVESLLRTGLSFDLSTLERRIKRLDAKLDQIEARVPGCMSIRFEDLAREETCLALAGHVGVPHNHERWAAYDALNLQVDFPAIIRYCAAHEKQMVRAANFATQRIRSQILGRPVVSQEFTFAQESIDAWLRDGAGLINDHLVMVGELPSVGLKNLPLLRKLEECGVLHITTARQNGRMFGYMLALSAPSLEAEGKQDALNASFYTSPDAPGLGLKLQRASIEFMRGRGVDTMLFRAGVRGFGPRMGVVYRRLGAEVFGEMYSLDLKGAA
jgi:hypothetical protein